VAATQFVPGYSDRIASTLENVEDDARTSINRCNWHAYCKSPVLGYGVGDYHAKQVEQYAEDGYDYGASASFNAHNQYLESLLAAGIPGLLALLLFFLLPVYMALRIQSSHRFVITLFMAVVLFNLLFESMLERQMGLLFVGSMYPVMVLIMSLKENKFVQSVKS
jgi:O-antigen ligase